jgi:hypothetical protein
MHESIKRRKGQCSMSLDKSPTVEEEKDRMAAASDVRVGCSVHIKLMAWRRTVSKGRARDRSNGRGVCAEKRGIVRKCWEDLIRDRSAELLEVCHGGSEQ